ncbi:MAG: aldo/keto reductase [Gammaproteobacteria bacterium]|nr:aldo/keto reductase [Gammaproteobacteria bacterium]MDH3468701.1 aldo/keto reductase [Gammaproteobacteria bacterium]
MSQTQDTAVNTLALPAVGFGTMTLGDQVDQRGSMQLLDIAIEHGATLIDTANSYNAGRAEEIVGRWIRSRSIRDEIVLATKVRYRVGDDAGTEGLDPDVVLAQIDASLRRLDVDHVDVLYLHQPDDDVPLDTTWECLHRIVSAGKVRHIGLSNFAAWQIAGADHVAAHHGWPRPAVVQPVYNAIARGAASELWPMTREYGIATCIYNPLAGGLLTAKYAAVDSPVAGTRLARSETYRRRYWHPRQREAAARLADCAAQNGRSATELALRFVLDDANVDCVLLGATGFAQLRESLQIVAAPRLSAAERECCDGVWRWLQGPIPRYYRTNDQATA